jgi:toxin ParE1/3/4
MSARIVRKDGARRDLIAHFVRIGRNSLASADKFLIAAEDAFAFLVGMPGLGSPWETRNPEHHGLRFWQICGFPNHLIFYREIPDGIEVIRVLHGSQDIEGIFGDEA